MSDTTTDVPHALTPEEWGRAFGGEINDDGIAIGDGVFAYVVDGELTVATEEGNAVGSVDEPAKLIALANAALPDTDPRKITRKTVATLRELIDAADHDDAGPWGESWQSDELVAVLTAARAIVDALESYLPPE